MNTQFERPAMVLLSAVWTLAAVLSIAAFTVSAMASVRPLPAASSQSDVGSAKSVETVTASSMLREPGLAISKDKLD